MNAPATVATNKPLVVQLRERLQSRYDELKAALPSDISPERFIRAIMTAVALNPDLLGCSWQTLWTGCMRACRDGLLPDGIEGALVPYKGQITWIPMYQGQVSKFRKSGQFKWIKADVVRAGEPFEHWVDENGEHFKHVPGDKFEAPIEKVYAMAITKDQGVFITVMTLAEANKAREMSKASREDAPWKKWPEEMYKKTALRRLSKLLPTVRDLPRDDDELVERSGTIGALVDDSAPPPEEETEKPKTVSGAAAQLDQFANEATVRAEDQGRK